MRIITTSIILCLLSLVSVMAQRDSITYLALGDSYTVGTGELEANSWPVQLVKNLNKKKIALKSPEIIAGAGWTTQKLISEIENDDLKSDYNLVSLLIGVNNQYQGMAFEVFEKDFPKLIETAITLAQNDPSNVFVLSIPDWGVTPFARSKDRVKISTELARYNTLIRETCEQHGIMYIGITKASRNMLFDKSLLASDSLHPSKKMYKNWASRARKQLIKKLQ